MRGAVFRPESWTALNWRNYRTKAEREMVVQMADHAMAMARMRAGFQSPSEWMRCSDAERVEAVYECTPLPICGSWSST